EVVGGGRDGAAEGDAESPRADVWRERGLDRLTGGRRVLSDADAMAPRPGLEHMPRGTAQFQGRLAGHRFDVGNASDPIGPKQPTHHRLLPLSFTHVPTTTR